mmetsp:Transcript_22180/g.48116  ORF Transcript_22180/g.48116 Transcript_22180/m.48116 type:complete len:80 (-) Transcript_22180:925-1164(-)
MDHPHKLRSTFFMQKRDKAVFETELNLSELEGPFPILLGSVKAELEDDEDHPQEGTRLFSVFLRGSKNSGENKSWRFVV